MNPKPRGFARTTLRKLFSPLLSEFATTQREMSALKMLVAQPLCHRVRAIPQPGTLQDVEFKVFSQWGEDGIIEWLLSRIDISNEQFVEFGVSDYQESNTRFLLKQHNWRGLVLDGSPANIDWIRHDEIYWQHELTAIAAFIDRDNINSLIRENGFSGDIGLLSIDLDGNDYWIWKQIDVVSPRIVICEYNSVFGADHSITVPYQADFNRTAAHYSNLYFGASIQALCGLAEEKNYIFIGCTSAGNDAFFVRRDCAAGLRSVAPGVGYVESRARESRDQNGALSHVSGKDRLALIKDCIVYDVVQEKTKRLQELFGV